VIQSGEHFSDGGRVGNHANSSHDLGQISSWDDGWWLIVDSDLESSRAPVDELDGSLGLDGGDGGVHVFWNDVSSVHHGAGHVLSVSWVAFGHHGGRFEGGVGDFGDGQLLVIGLFGGDDRGVGGQHEVDSRIWHQVGLEFGDIDVQGSVESQGGGQGGDDLGDQSV
jgi:hypothetical protein